jgi:hypothetical protein
MTVTPIRYAVQTVLSPAERLKELNADIAAIEARQGDPQGWGKLLADERSKLLAKRAELVALTATTVLAA